MHGNRLGPLLLATAALTGAWPAAFGQPAKGPIFPPIAPAQARLDQTINGLDGPGLGIAFSESRGVLAASCECGTVQLWRKDVLLNARAGNGTSAVLRGQGGPVTGLAWDGGPVLASAGGGKILLRAAADGKLLHTLPADRQVRALAMSPDGKLLASSGDDPTIQVWELETGKLVASLRDHTDWVLCLAFAPDGKALASGGYDGLVRLWDAGSGKKVRDLSAAPVPPPKQPPEVSAVLSLAFSPDGKTVAIGSADGLIRLANVADGKMVRALPGHTSAVAGLAFHPGGKLLASAGKDRTVRLWDPTNGQALKVLEGHTAWVQGIVFVLHGTRLASVSADQTVRIWDLTEPPKK
jgi:WD40 repeat protein